MIYKTSVDLNVHFVDLNLFEKLKPALHQVMLNESSVTKGEFWYSAELILGDTRISFYSEHFFKKNEGVNL